MVRCRQRLRRHMPRRRHRTVPGPAGAFAHDLVRPNQRRHRLQRLLIRHTRQEQPAGVVGLQRPRRRVALDRLDLRFVLPHCHQLQTLATPGSRDRQQPSQRGAVRGLVEHQQQTGTDRQTTQRRRALLSSTHDRVDQRLDSSTTGVGRTGVAALRSRQAGSAGRGRRVRTTTRRPVPATARGHR